MTHALLLAATVVIRTFNYGQVPPDDLAHARDTADRAFHHAGIFLQWIECAVPMRSFSDTGRSMIDDGRSTLDDRGSCLTPLREGVDFILRLMQSTPPPTGAISPRRVAMGSSLLDIDARAGALTTVDPDAVLEIARAAGAEFPTLLGRAIAHEIGHLLLGRSGHSRNGLMRAIWSRDEIRGSRPAGWQFSASEAAQMQRGLAGRSRAAN
jgi:hypothetical protein